MSVRKYINQVGKLCKLYSINVESLNFSSEYWKLYYRS